ncbi:MAG: helix-turn-helix transcriptional regulator [Halioglobus sp.]|nr:helix-turn-helix transcriptional regulator [Halioglobus sp.]
MAANNYGQFCPIAKAMDLLGEKWTLLILRELIMGGSRFNELQRGLSHISPTLLTKRLGMLEEEGLLVKRRIPGQRGYEYFPTEACKSLLPVLEAVGTWGMRWARHTMMDDDFDLELLMLYMERSVDPEKLPGRETVVRFHFTDVSDSNTNTWWLVANEDGTDVCLHDPGKEVDVYLNVGLRTMCELWMGDISYRRAIKEEKLQVVGPAALTRNISDWITPSMFAGIEPAERILAPV